MVYGVLSELRVSPRDIATGATNDAYQSLTGLGFHHKTYIDNKFDPQVGGRQSCFTCPDNQQPSKTYQQVGRGGTCSMAFEQQPSVAWGSRRAAPLLTGLLHQTARTGSERSAFPTTTTARRRDKGPEGQGLGPTRLHIILICCRPAAPHRLPPSGGATACSSRRTASGAPGGACTAPSSASTPSTWCCSTRCRRRWVSLRCVCGARGCQQARLPPGAVPRDAGAGGLACVVCVWHEGVSRHACHLVLFHAMQAQVG